jgi:hypothetical protein
MGTTANMTTMDQLTEHDRTELLARAQDRWERAPQNTMKAVFEWGGKNYVVLKSRSIERQISRTRQKGGSLSHESPPVLRRPHQCFVKLNLMASADCEPTSGSHAFGVLVNVDRKLPCGQPIDNGP